MKARPILMSAPMVRALLDGRKTQTRRVVKGMPPAPKDDSMKWPPKHPAPYFDADCGGRKTAANPRGMTDLWSWWTRDDRQGYGCKCPYGVPGDQLWVRETWRPQSALGPWDIDITYAADGEARTLKDGEFEAGDWIMPKAAETGNVSALFMPRWASRLTLEITEVRVERLQDISEADALAEGVYRMAPDAADLDNGCTPDDFVFMAPGTRQGWGMTKAERDREQWGPTASFAYSRTWEAINGHGSWDANPWVWALTFKTHRVNVGDLVPGRDDR